MKKLLASVCFCILFALSTQAQDTIVKTNGEELRVKVLEVNERMVKFLRADNLKGATLQLYRSEVAVIKYSNGIREVINARAAANQAIIPKDSLQQPQHVRAATPPHELITRERGRFYYRGDRIGIRQVNRIITESGNQKAIMQLKMYKRTSRNGKALTITGICLASIGLPVFAISTLVKSDMHPSHSGYAFFSTTQVAGGVMAAAGIGCFVGGLGNRTKAALALQQTIETYNAGIKQPE